MTRKLMMMAVAAAAAFGAWAETETVGGYTWTYRINGDTAEIYNDGKAAISPDPTGVVTIPETLGGRLVMKLGNDAFYKRKLTGVIIPKSVKSIGRSFRFCSELESVIMPSSVTNVGAAAFAYCSKLTSVHISDLAAWCRINFENRYSHPFVGSNGGGDMYLNGRLVADLRLPDDVTNVGRYAFYKCRSIKTVATGDGVTKIGEEAFSQCTGLTDVEIGSSVADVNTSIFSACGSFTAFRVSGVNPFFKTVSGMLISKDGRTLVAVPYGLAIGSMAIPNGVERIGDGAFYHCYGLTKVTIPNSVLDIGRMAFYGSGLTSVQIPDSVLGIGEEAFYDCEDITKVSLGSGVVQIGGSAFRSCQNLSSFAVAGGNRSYKVASGMLLSKDGKTLVAVPAKTSRAAIPAGVTSIGDGMFADCWENLVSVTIPDSVVSIGYEAFDGCEKLRSITIPSSVVDIGGYAFLCTGLLEVKLYEGLQRIGAYAFSGCEVANVTVPGTVLSVGDGAFADCLSLRKVKLPETLKGIIDETNVFSRAYCEECGEVKPDLPEIVYYTPGVETVKVSVSVAEGCEAMGTVTGGGEVKPETQIAITARASPGYVFAGWYAGGKPLEGPEDYRSAKLRYGVSVVPVAIEARFATSAEDALSLKINLPPRVDVDKEDRSLEFNAVSCVSSDSIPKLSFSGLPAGLKFDSKSGIISGKATKPGVYKVSVSATNASVKKPMVSEFELVVPNLESEVFPNLQPETDAYGIIKCGVAFDTDLIDCTSEDGWAVKVAGLPPGLKFKEGVITGVPAKAGSYTVAFTATRNGEKAQTATITINVEALPEWATGTFVGYVGSYEMVYNVTIEYEEVGMATLTVSPNGRASGKVSLCGTNWTFSATSYAYTDTDEFVIQSELKSGKLSVPVEFSITPCEVTVDSIPSLKNAYASGYMTEVQKEGDIGLDFCLWRNMWKDKATAAEAKATIAGFEGVYTLSMDDGGYLSLTVGKNGDVKASGKLADGTSVSATSPLMYDDEAGWFVMLYAAPSSYKGGSFAAAVGFEDRLAPVMFTPQWTSRNPQATGEYGEGFVRDVDLFGAYYNKLDTLRKYYEAVRLGLDVVPELGFTYKETSLNEQGKKVTTSYAATAEGVDTFSQSGMTVSVNEKGALVVAKATKPVQDKTTKTWSYDGTNDGALSLSFAQATGIFKGSYTFWYDYVSAYDETKAKDNETKAHTSKKVSFEGILVQGEEPKMDGFYLWDATGEYMDEKSGKPKTYKYKQSFPARLIAE